MICHRCGSDIGPGREWWPVFAPSAISSYFGPKVLCACCAEYFTRADGWAGVSFSLFVFSVPVVMYMGDLEETP